MEYNIIFILKFTNNQWKRNALPYPTLQNPYWDRWGKFVYSCKGGIAFLWFRCIFVEIENNGKTVTTCIEMHNYIFRVIQTYLKNVKMEQYLHSLNLT